MALLPAHLPAPGFPPAKSGQLLLVPRKPIPIWGAGFKNIQRGSSPGTHRVAPAHSQYPSGVCVHLPGTRTVPGSDGGFRGDGDNPPPPSCPLSPHATRGHEATLGTWQRGGDSGSAGGSFPRLHANPGCKLPAGLCKASTLPAVPAWDLPGSSRQQHPVRSPLPYSSAFAFTRSLVAFRVPPATNPPDGTTRHKFPQRPQLCPRSGQ